MGAPGEAEAYLAQLRARMGGENHVLGYALVALGRAEEGLRLLETTNPISWTQLFFAPMMDSIHDTPATRALFAKLGALELYERARANLGRLSQQNTNRQ